MENNLFDSFIIYRLPSETRSYLVEGNCSPEPKNLDELQGNNFLISPFNNGQKAFYIPFENPKEIDFQRNFYFHIKKSKETTLPKEHYLEIVKKAKEEMRKRSFNKVVLANTKRIPKKNFDPLAFLSKIEKEYPNAFVYLLSTPQTGVWIGASPELLLHGKNKTFKTIALAGTKHISEKQEFGSKEIKEQHHVEQFIESELEKKEIKYSKKGPIPHRSGTLTHLKSEYTFQILDREEFSLLAKLNPTPATAGLPKNESLEFIKNNEGINRDLYAGFLGYTMQQSMELFVNLRCLKYTEDALILYAGAGITIDSEEEKEWVETQNKMAILENFL